MNLPNRPVSRICGVPSRRVRRDVCRCWRDSGAETKSHAKTPIGGGAKQEMGIGE